MRDRSSEFERHRPRLFGIAFRTVAGNYRPGMHKSWIAGAEGSDAGHDP
jgi:hypothetical protein